MNSTDSELLTTNTSRNAFVAVGGIIALLLLLLSIALSITIFHHHLGSCISISHGNHVCLLTTDTLTCWDDDDEQWWQHLALFKMPWLDDFCILYHNTLHIPDCLLGIIVKRNTVVEQGLHAHVCRHVCWFFTGGNYVLNYHSFFYWIENCCISTADCHRKLCIHSHCIMDTATARRMTIM